MVILFIYSYKLTLCTTAILAPIFCMTPIYGKFIKKINKDISDGKAASSNVAEEAMSNIRTVKAFSTEDHECKKYEDRNEYIYKRAKDAARCYGFF